MDTGTVHTIGELSTIIALHYGPGPHPGGSPQQVHAGGQLAFDFGQQPATQSAIDADAEAERARRHLLDTAARYEQRLAAARQQREAWAAKERTLYNQLYDADNRLRPGMTAGPDNALFSAWRDAIAELHRSEEAVFALLAAREEKLFDVIGAERPADFGVLAENPDPKMVPNAIRQDWAGLGPKLQQVVKGGLRMFNRLIDAEAASSTAPRNINFTFDSRHRRACYIPPLNTICVVSTSGHISVLHELGHFLENKTPGLRAYAGQFLEQRTAGEAARPLKEIAPNTSYADWETARPDKFKNPYVGKVYKDGTTEVISMGLEYMATDPVEFARTDPDHWRFTYKVMRGLWKTERTRR